MKEFRHALVLGKFYPPHNGHHHLINAAAARSEHTTVTVLGSSAESLSIEDRVAWLRATHAETPGVAVLGDLDDHPMDFDSDDVWELHVGVARAVLARRAIQDGDPSGAPVDVVFSSEKYGDELARRLGAQHVCVDAERVTHTVSGTAVRFDTRGQWHHLAPATRAGLAARVVVVGAESSGTTTLSCALAARFDAPWVPEYGREHTEAKLEALRASHPDATVDSLVWTVGDFVDVAVRQQELIDRACTAPLVVCDNDAWAATVWCRRYLGLSYPLPAGTPPHLYLLTDHEGVPFEQDGWRDGEHLRPWMTSLFASSLEATGVPWVRLTGSFEARLTRAVEACEELMDGHFRYAPPLG